MFDWIRNKNTGVTIKIKGTKTITKEYCEKWQCHQLTTYMKFIHTYSLATLSSEDTENVNRSVTARKIQLIFSKHQNQQLNFTAEFYQTSEELTRMFFKLFQGKKKKPGDMDIRPTCYDAHGHPRKPGAPPLPISASHPRWEATTKAVDSWVPTNHIGDWSWAPGFGLAQPC